jgi:hypothetical protein
MAEVLVQFTHSLQGRDGRLYAAHAAGRPREDGEWEVGIEFCPAPDGAPIRSPRETTQPNREDLLYWATGLTPTYLEGALERALDRGPTGEPTVAQQPAFNAPAPARATPAPGELRPRPVLNPFEVYSRSGEDILRQELSALDATHLRNIIAAYRMYTDVPVTSDRSALAELIVAAVRRGGG